MFPLRSFSQRPLDLSALSGYPPNRNEDFCIPLFANPGSSLLVAPISSLQLPGKQPTNIWLCAELLRYRIWLDDPYAVVSTFVSPDRARI